MSELWSLWYDKNEYNAGNRPLNIIWRDGPSVILWLLSGQLAICYNVVISISLAYYIFQGRIFFSISRTFKSSKYFTIETYSFSPFVLRLFIMNSRAISWGYRTYSGLSRIFLSKGSPGIVYQWSKVDREKACPTVWILGSVWIQELTYRDKSFYNVMRSSNFRKIILIRSSFLEEEGEDSFDHFLIRELDFQYNRRVPSFWGSLLERLSTRLFWLWVWFVLRTFTGEGRYLGIYYSKFVISHWLIAERTLTSCPYNALDHTLLNFV